MARKKASSKHTFHKRIRQNKIFLLVAGLLILFVILFPAKLLFLNEHTTEKNIKKVSVATPPTVTPTQIPSPTAIYYPQATPIPTVPVLKYNLIKSADEIHLHPKATGYAISATLVDEKGNVVTHQNDYKYAWSIDDKDLVLDGYGSFDGCTQGIEQPCPQDHFSFYAEKAGKTVIRVRVTKGDDTVAETTFPLIIED